MVVDGGIILDTDTTNPVSADEYQWVQAPTAGKAGNILDAPNGLWEVGAPHVVTAIFGWPITPHAVIQAALMQSSRYFARRESPLGYSWGGSAPGFYPMRLDPDIHKMLSTANLTSMVN